VLESREKVLRCERDFGTMHGMLSNLPLAMNVEKVVARALVLFHQLPPTQLRQRSGVENSPVYVFARCEVFCMTRLNANFVAVCCSSSMYFQFPFEYQQWPSVTAPMLKEVPPLPLRKPRLVRGLYSLTHLLC